MILLALDTCLGACAGAIVQDGKVLSRIVEPMQRGHQERIATMTAGLLIAAELSFTAIDRIAVTVGPGSFTGLRIGLVFAKGLGVALDRPCAGIGVLELLGRQAGGGTALAVLDARAGHVHCQAFRDGTPCGSAQTLALEQARGLAAPETLIGDGAPLLADAFPKANQSLPQACDPVLVAILGARDPCAPLDPVYMRAAYA